MKKALALGLVLVLAMSVSALAASVDGSLKFEYDYEIEDDWTLTITPENGIPKAELVLNVKDEGWAFNAEIRRILEGKDVMQLRQIKANLDEPQVALTIWANGKETEDKKDPLEFIKSSKLQEGRDPKFRLEAGVFGVSAVVDYQNGKATVPKPVKVGEQVCILAEDVVFEDENNDENNIKKAESYKVVADEVETDKLYGFLDTTVQGNKVGLAYYSDMAAEKDARKRTAVAFGELGFQGVTAKLGAGMTFGEDVSDKNVLYGVDVKVPIPGYEVVAVQGKWRLAQENVFSTFGSDKRVAELYGLYQDSLIKGKAGVKGENAAEYEKDNEVYTFLAEVTVREKDDGPDFDDVMEDYDELTGYAVKAEVSRTSSKLFEDNPLTRLYLGAGSRFMENLVGKVELEYKSAKDAANHLRAAYPDPEVVGTSEVQYAYWNEAQGKYTGFTDEVETSDKFYKGYYKLSGEVTYDVGAGVTLIPFASLEKYSGGASDAWQSTSAFGTEVEYALSSSVTLGAGVERAITKWDKSTEDNSTEDNSTEDTEVKETTGFFNVKVAF